MLYKILIVTTLLFLPGCDVEDILGTAEHPTCDVTRIQTYDAGMGTFATFAITAKNINGRLTAYNVGCSVKIRKGTTVIESNTGYFGTLSPGESAIEELWFTRFKSNSEYDNTIIELYWYDENNNFYSKEVH